MNNPLLPVALKSPGNVIDLIKKKIILFCCYTFEDVGALSQLNPS